MLITIDDSKVHEARKLINAIAPSTLPIKKRLELLRQALHQIDAQAQPLISPELKVLNDKIKIIGTEIWFLESKKAGDVC